MACSNLIVCGLSFYMENVMRDTNELMIVAREIHLTKQEYLDEMLENAELVRKSYKKRAYYEGYMDGLDTASAILWKFIMAQDEDGGEE